MSNQPLWWHQTGWRRYLPGRVAAFLMQIRLIFLLPKHGYKLKKIKGRTLEFEFKDNKVSQVE